MLTLVEDLEARIPNWVTGNITRKDMEFLYSELVREKPKVVVEIGVASGASTALLLKTMAYLDQIAPLNDSEVRKVISYDYDEKIYFDRSKKVGVLVDELCPELKDNLKLRSPNTVVDFPKFHAPRSIDFLFLDANHAHPNPTLDLLMLLDFLSDKALVVFHDIHLGTLMPECSAHGVDYLFESLEGELRTADNVSPNIGSWRMTPDRELLRKRLGRVVLEKKWDQCPPLNYLVPTSALVPASRYVLKFVLAFFAKMAVKARVQVLGSDY